MGHIKILQKEKVRPHQPVLYTEILAGVLIENYILRGNWEFLKLSLSNTPLIPNKITASRKITPSK